MLAETEKCFKGFMQLSTPVAELFNIFELRKILFNKKDDHFSEAHAQNMCPI